MERVNIQINNKKYLAFVALTEEEKTTGLSTITEDLADGEGMLFVYEEPDDLYFTMEDTEIDLDIIFIDENGVVTKVYHADALSEEPYEGLNSQFVFETKINSGIKEGDQLTFLSSDDEDSLDEDDKETIRKFGRMLILNADGDVLYRLEGGERIMSRISTRKLIKAAIKAYRSDNDSDYIKVGKIVLNELEAQDNREPQYVEGPTKHDGGGEITAYTDALKKTIDELWTLIKNRGYSDNATAAIIGNLMQESSLDHSKVSSKNARGIAQLLGDEYKDYQRYLARTGLADNAVNQVGFILSQIDRGSNGWSRDYDRIAESVINYEKRIDNKEKLLDWEVKDYKNKIAYIGNTYRFNNGGNYRNAKPIRHMSHLTTAFLAQDSTLENLVELYMNTVEKPGDNEAMLDLRFRYAREILALKTKPTTTLSTQLRQRQLSLQQQLQLPIVAQGVPQQTGTRYKIKRGDSLTSIAARFGISVRTLMEANNLTTDAIRADDYLNIPSRKEGGVLINQDIIEKYLLYHKDDLIEFSKLFN